MVRSALLSAALTLPLILSSIPSQAAELVIWHDKGEEGIRMIDEMGKAFAASRPGTTVRSVSMPTDQWISKSIAALNTGTAPDLLFNDNPRVIQIQQTTGKLADLGQALAAIDPQAKEHVNKGDIAASTLKGQVVMMPFQRVISAWGVRKSWLEKVGAKTPTTWAETLDVARKFQAGDPDGNGRPDTFGMALQAANAGSLYGGGALLFVLGSGADYALIDEDANVVIDKPEVSRPLVEFLKVFTEYKLTAPDTINHGFSEMYQLIEGGRAGFFRVGNWNVKKWDTQTIKGDFAVLPYPSFGAKPGAMIVTTVRGMAVPQASPNKELAVEFAKFLLSKGAQQASLDHMGGAVRSDLDLSGITPSLRPFVASDTRLVSDDFLSAKYPWFLELREAYFKQLIGAITSPPKDWDAWVKQTAEGLRAEVKKLQAKNG